MFAKRLSLPLAIAALALTGAAGAHAETTEQVMRQVAAAHPDYPANDLEFHMNYLRSMGYADKKAVPGSGQYHIAFFAPGMNTAMLYADYYDNGDESRAAGRLACGMGSCVNTPMGQYGDFR